MTKYQLYLALLKTSEANADDRAEGAKSNQSVVHLQALVGGQLTGNRLTIQAVVVQRQQEAQAVQLVWPERATLERCWHCNILPVGADTRKSSA